MILYNFALTGFYGNSVYGGLGPYFAYNGYGGYGTYGGRYGHLGLALGYDPHYNRGYGGPSYGYGYHTYGEKVK